MHLPLFIHARLLSLGPREQLVRQVQRGLFQQTLATRGIISFGMQILLLGQWEARR